MKHFPSVFLIGLGLALSCHHPEVEYVDFDTFQPISVQSAPFFMEDGNLNPDVAMMGDTDLEPDTKVARTEGVTLVKDLLGVVNSNSLVHIAGVFQGHDVDGSPSPASLSCRPPGPSRT